jgi:hypothetical protein
MTLVQAQPIDASNGWDAFTHDDLLAVLQGNDQITGYYDIERRKRLAEFGMEPPHGSIDLTYEPSEFLSEFAIRRLQYYEEQRIVIWNQDLGYRYIPVTVRGMKYYRLKIEEQFQLLHDFMFENRLSCVHLRVSPRAGPGKSPLTSLIEMKEFLNPFLSFVQRTLGYRPFYVWAIEPTKRGHCHYHIIFVGISWLMPKEKIDKWFTDHGYGTSAGIYVETLRADTRVKAGKELYKLLNYLIEYVSKPQSDMKWQGLLTLTRKREWGMSSKLRQILLAYAERRLRLSCNIGRTNSTAYHEWIFIGIMSLTMIEELIGDKNPPPDELMSDLMDISGSLRRLTHPSLGF